jgi:GTP cyclohydrolase FolE2
VIAFVDAVQAGGKSVSPTNQIYSAHYLIFPNEHHLTMQAYETPVLIEDVVRNSATILKTDGRVTWVEVHAMNQGSIYNHSSVSEVVNSQAEWRSLK